MIPLNKVHKDLPPEEPPLSVIIPYDRGIRFNGIHVSPEDEVIFVLNGETIGHKRITGVKLARYEWTVHIDADGVYPREYIPQVKRAIRKHGDRFSVMMATRLGGIPIARLLESGMIAKKQTFLRATKDYPNRFPCNLQKKKRGFWLDVVGCFRDEPYIIIDAFYYHPLSKDERKWLLSLIPLTALL